MNKKDAPKLSDDNLTIEFNADDFKKSLPHLSSELISGEKKINIQGIENKISLEEFDILKDQIKNQGLSSFGSHKKKGYYEKKFKRNIIQ